MHLHKNARLTPITREELVRSVVQDFVPLSAAAAEFNVSPKTAAKSVRFAFRRKVVRVNALALDASCGFTGYAANSRRFVQWNMRRKQVFVFASLGG
jgi:hypothetical protein